MINYKIRVRNLIRKHNTRCPYRLAKELGIHIYECNLSDDMPKGLFKKMLGKKFIVLNVTRIKNEFEKQFVLAHELGHAVLHSNDTTFFLHDHTFCNRGKFEIQANKFAAELLINETYIDESCLKTLSVEQLAAYFCVPKELIIYKFF
ncbi:membrane protein [Clostridium novyi A str. BKT29909]|uniref:ImmA/IrrE family metallo-endopeptidase n=1 Tax=Clostridium novyi TaxID=1542 RepID=UPI0004DA4CF9|nr:ImmA/IrrE family metallo-endopeptidase [Clostridium novyi]KEH89628.1 membrane protein [Clostridium novyi A str. BKT29909]